MIRLHNDFLAVDILLKGGEIQTITDLKTNQNYLWYKDPIAWKDCAIPLFPIVGRLIDDRFEWEGKMYQLTGHGLARHAIFSIESMTQTKVTLLFKSNADTLMQYPFHFEFRVTYELINHSVVTHFNIKNTNQNNLPFSIGGHPAFKVPFYDGETMEDYYLEFNHSESASLYAGNSSLVLNNETIIPLKEDSFNKEAIIFKNLKSNIVSLKNKAGNYHVEVDFTGFPIIAFWPSSVWNHLLAIEPWFGHADLTNKRVDFDERPGTIILEKNQEFDCQFIITIK